MAALHVWGNVNTEGKGKIKDFSVTVLIVCWLVAAAYGGLAERSPGAFQAGCWQVRCVLKWAGCAQLSLLCWGWKPHVVAEGLRAFSALLLLECTTGPFCSTLHPAWVQQHTVAMALSKVMNIGWSLCVPWPGSLWYQHGASCKDALPAFAAQSIPGDCLTVPTSVSLPTLSL